MLSPNSAGQKTRAELGKEGRKEEKNRGAVKDLGRIVLEMLLVFMRSFTGQGGSQASGLGLLAPGHSRKFSKEAPGTATRLQTNQFP